MAKTLYNKLVRDRIPEIMRANGETPQLEILDDQRYLEELTKKLGEEVLEYQIGGEVEELADVLAVLYAICEARGISRDELEQMRMRKEQKNGGFSRKLFLVSKES